MKVLFADIDGVLNTKNTSNPRKLPYVVDKKLVGRLNRLTARTGAKVVLISTWRYDPAGLFSAKRYGIPFIGCTPDFPHRSRCDEIRAWLRKHRPVTRFAVIDDDDDELDELPLFQPHPDEGLTASLANEIVSYLAGRTDQDQRRNAVVRLAKNLSNLITGHRG
jgi:hypothetical protein